MLIGAILSAIFDLCVCVWGGGGGGILQPYFFCGWAFFSNLYLRTGLTSAIFYLKMGLLQPHFTCGLDLLQPSFSLQLGLIQLYVNCGRASLAIFELLLELLLHLICKSSFPKPMGCYKLNHLLRTLIQNYFPCMGENCQILLIYYGGNFPLCFFSLLRTLHTECG